MYRVCARESDGGLMETFYKQVWAGGQSTRKAYPLDTSAYVQVSRRRINHQFSQIIGSLSNGSGSHFGHHTGNFIDTVGRRDGTRFHLVWARNIVMVE
jgi:hypothetical protein